MQIHVSNSSLSAWQDCKLQWWMSNIAELRAPEPIESPAATGTLVHAMIEAELTDGTGQATFDAAIEARGVLASDKEVLNAWASWRENLLPLYEGAKTIQTEVRVERKYGDTLISGVIDAIVEMPRGRVMIVDHKTTGKLPGAWLRANGMAVARQLQTYAYLLDEWPNAAVIDLIPTWGVMGVAERHTWALSREMRMQAGWRLFAKIDEMHDWLDDDVASPPRTGKIPGEYEWQTWMSPGRQCEYCDYRPICSQVLAGNPEPPKRMAAKVLVHTPRYGYRDRSHGAS